MLSIETPPDPSCSSKASQLKTDERASGQLPFQEADPVDFADIHTPNFSIRDYVFTSRSKSIETNWPFPQKFLKRCLHHGIKDLLPPFEPPTLVRSPCYGKATESKQLEPEKISSKIKTIDVGSKSIVPSDELEVDSSDQAQYHSPEKRKPAVDQRVILDDKLTDSDAEVVSTVTTPGQIEVAELPAKPSNLEILKEPSEKKCRLVLKLCADSEARKVEDIASTSSTISDPMASKVCPVCKTFSSTSNTTLNAHIDQCLSVDSNTNQDAANISKFKVKPRKKRLMVDIYATAPYCTLEELDRRNGTNWATDLSLVAPAAVACAVAKRPRLAPVDIRDDGDEGAVYVDSNGIKLRILSKFNDTPPVIPREEFKPRKHAKEIKEGKRLLISKKKRFTPKYLKHMKMKLQSKKLSSFESLNGEIQAAPEGDHHAGHRQEKKRSQLQISSARDQVRSNVCATLRQWVCSKRSDLPKKINKKDVHKSSENPKVATTLPSPVSNQPDSNNYTVVRSHILKFSRSSEDLTSFKSKRVDSLETMSTGKQKSPNPLVLDPKFSSENTLKNGLMLKLPRSLANSVSSPRSKREDIHMGSTRKLDNSSYTATRTSESCHRTLKAKSIETLRKNVADGRSSVSLEASSGDVSEKTSNSKKFRKHRSVMVSSKRGGELPSDVRTHRFSKNSAIVDLMTPSLLESAKGREVAAVREWILHSEGVQLGDDTEVVASIEKVDGNHFGRETLISNNLAPDSIAKLDHNPFVEQTMHSTPVTDSLEEPKAQCSFDKQEMQCCDVICDEIVSQNIEVAEEVVLQGENLESHTETASAQESSACLTSTHRDVGIEIPQENSSITSIRVPSGQDRNLGIDRETSSSPISTASTVPPPSSNDSQPKAPESKSLTRTENIGGTQGRDAGKIYPEFEMGSVVKEPRQLPGDQPCCCSRREGLSREFQFMRQSIMAGTMLPSKGKQTSNMYIAPSVSSPFTSYPSPRTILESPTESISTKASSDSSAKFPASCSGLGSPSPSSVAQNQNQPTAKPILRLMGKNLMVANKGESALHPKVNPPATDNSFLPPPGFAYTSNVMNQETFWYHHRYQLPNGSSILGPPPPIATHQLPFHAGMIVKPDRQTHQKKFNKKVSCSRAPNAMKEVIVIDDSPETESELKANLVSPSSTLPTFPGSNPIVQRPFSCFPSQNQFVLRDFSGGFNPSFQNACPKEFSSCPTKRGSNSEASGPPLLPSPFLFQSPSMYYSQTL